MVYDNRHRAFLQAIMHGGAVLEHTVKAIFSRIFKENADMSAIISVINDKLAPIGMCMKSGTCEITGQKYWCVVGTTHEDSVEIPCEFSKPERAFLRVVFSEIINSDDGCILSTDCLNLTHNLDMKFTVGDADSFLKKMIRSKWLHRASSGYYYMGIRSIIELMPYFKATYQDNFHKCHLCKDVMFHGHKCERCDEVFHYFCISKKIADLQVDKCPNCLHNMDCSEIIEFSNTQNLNETQATQNGNVEDRDEAMDVSDDIVFSQPADVSKRTKRKGKSNS